MKPILLVAAWLSLTAFGFWFYEARYLMPVHVDRPLNPIPVIEKERLGELVGTEGRRAVVLNFWNPTCGCSRFMETHVAELSRKFASSGVEFITVITGGTGSDQSQLSEAKSRSILGKLIVDHDQVIVKKYDILAAPAAVVFDQSSTPVYRGSYNISRTCTDPETAYVAKTLELLATDNKANLKSLPFYGCSNALK